ncbi:CI-like repressor [Paracoccus phage vB_PbeS_Pben1]|uniref:helix-turn-helix domain-containing protein n=1 Tax=Paracoccus versutus TaxID=34007 RepID=UPI000FDF7B5F|nr:helix-turn-helix transcriptional regulator [Paracoccus versutus]AZV00177.1 CI-like repressor [Paracoccus phage vB_PbeS_Pben1]WGR55725.1 XRE family transcriptional regulator [Paracoccus versutus]
MATNDAIIAPFVNRQSCENRPYHSRAISATSHTMEKIDRHWIRARLAGMPRGTQKRLADHLGIASNMMSKIMSGKRLLQQDEVPKVLSFFNARIIADEGIARDREVLLRGVDQLNSDGLRLLQRQLDEMLQTPSLVERDESTPPTNGPGEGVD